EEHGSQRNRQAEEPSYEIGEVELIGVDCPSYSAQDQESQPDQTRDSPHAGIRRKLEMLPRIVARRARRVEHDSRKAVTLNTLCHLQTEFYYCAPASGAVVVSCGALETAC